MPEEGIEIHFDEKSGYLQLACEPDAFRPYRELARSQLEDFPEIDVDKVLEMVITDTATFVARRDAPKRRMWDIVFMLFIVATLGLAIVGAFSLIGRLAAR